MTEALIHIGEDARAALPLPDLWQPPTRRTSTMLEPSFKISSFCHGGGCVGVAAGTGDSVIVINTAVDGLDRLVFTAAEWDAFISGAKNCEFDRAALS
jgi:hypothetical protein